MKDIDWARLTDDVLGSLVLTQNDLASRCKVTKQSISNWKNGLRSPGIFAREKLMELLDELKIERDKYIVEGLDAMRKKPFKEKTQLPDDVATFAARLSKLPKRKRREVIAMADFFLSRN
ncbi:MAG: helix-turn-helix domain-containing protein [Lentisphaeraceae bacterium]|nr:helix-turn-helix domain-containing protein [Lentisphaeraceae bacterium]